MKHYIGIGEASILLGVCRTTIRRWDKDGKIQCYRTPGGHRRFSLIEIERIVSNDIISDVERLDDPQAEVGAKTAIYARVSSHDQKKKGDLDRQIEAAIKYCEGRGTSHVRVFRDISSGLNTKRSGLARLCRAIERKEIDRVIITYPDRLTRFGFSYLESYFASHGTVIEVMQQPPDQSMEEEMVQDMIAIITSFSGRVHGLRSAKRRKKTRYQSPPPDQSETKTFIQGSAAA